MNIRSEKGEIDMAKFKIGDKVRVLDGSKIDDYTGGWVYLMEKNVDIL